MADESLIALAISALSLGISSVTLWAASLARFRLRWSHSTPALMIYPIHAGKTPGNEKGWWIPSFDMGFSFHNTGRRAGVVEDVRIIVNVGGQEYSFHPMWVVDYQIFEEHRVPGAGKTKESIVRPWYPLVLQGGEAQHVHLVLRIEGVRWESKMEGIAVLTVWVFSSPPGKWQPCCTYLLPMDEGMYKGGNTYMPAESHLGHIRGSREATAFPTPDLQRGAK